ncbi:dehydrogenase/reductase SDR family member 13-like [Crotalus adamanteus]|uniref:Dehydrogenase/reductase SDR family member 13-like n=1 Tax=Crotalus adamanteus TaxID=8729 RepID=A0AAW1CDG9_CROAD
MRHHQRLGDLSESSFFWSFLGGNVGIGKATAVDLARRGARVILACRDKARGESAVCDIRRESGNSDVILMILDLANLNSVQTFAKTFLKSEPHLDILINNAGVFKAGQTADGFDEAFQVNHLAHFLLTHLLLDRMKRCAPSRVVIVATNFHFFGKIDFRIIHKPGEGMWQGPQSYCNSKLANILHARELANRLEGTNVTCYAVHPAFVFRICSNRNSSVPSPLGNLADLAHQAIPPRLENRHPDHHLLRHRGGHLSGQYFVDCQPKVPWPQARDDQMAEIFWEFSEMLLGLTAPPGKGQR